MKIKTTITTLSAIIALAMMAMSAFSQNNGLTPNAVSSFSTFSAPQNMGATLNSADNDIAPVAAPSGLSLYFSSNRPGMGGNDIYVSQRPTLTSAWGAPQNLGATVNTSSAEVASSFSLDGRTMFLQSQRPGGMGGNDIYISTRTDPNNDFGWTTPVNIGAVINTTAGELGAFYFEDLTTGINSIIFASDRNQVPGQDFYLFQSTRNADGTFNPPSLVNELNSVESAQLRPAIRRDGLEIFFGSIRPGGLTFLVFDIWVSTRASTTSPWNPPVLVSGINSLEEDRIPGLSPDGSILYFDSTRAGGSGGFDLYSTTRVSVNRSSTADFDGDGRTDLSVFRPSDSTWWVLQSGTNTVRVRQFGASGDKIAPGDYDGDGRIDLAIFRPSTASWWILQSSNNSFSVVTQFGLATDKPAPADYDGDGKTDIAVYRNGTWYIRRSSNLQVEIQQFGLSGDIPVAGVNVQ